MPLRMCGEAGHTIGTRLAHEHDMGFRQDRPRGQINILPNCEKATAAPYVTASSHSGIV